MPTVSINFLSRHTGKDRRTIKKRLDKLPQDAKGKFDSPAALEAIYLGPSPDGNGFITTAEAVRRLTIAKEKEIILDMEIKRGARIPIEDVSLTEKYIFAHIRGVIVASKLSADEKNEILDRLRDLPCLDGPRSEDQKCDPVIWQS
jgi:hypothetical protein